MLVHNENRQNVLFANIILSKSYYKCGQKEKFLHFTLQILNWGDFLKTAYIFKAKGMVLRVIPYLWSMKIFQQYCPTPSILWSFLTKLQFCCLNSHLNKSFSLPLNPILLVLSGQQMVAIWLQINIYTIYYYILIRSIFFPQEYVIKFEHTNTMFVFFISNIDVGNLAYQSYLPLKMSFQSVDVKSNTMYMIQIFLYCKLSLFMLKNYSFFFFKNILCAQLLL